MPSFSWSPLTPSNYSILQVIYPRYQGFFRSSPYISKTLIKPSLYHLFYNKWYPNVLSNAFIPNPILFGFSTKPTQHSHLCNIKFILLLAFYYAAFNSTQHHKSYNTQSSHPIHHPTWIPQFTCPSILGTNFDTLIDTLSLHKE